MRNKTPTTPSRLHEDLRGNKERGASVVEYAFLVLLIAIIAIVAVTIAGEQVSDVYSTLASGLQEANT